MQIWRETIRILEAAPGANVRINLVAIKPTSGEETQSLDLMRSLEPCGESDCAASDGTGSPHVFRPCTLSPFAGRVFTVFHRGADEELIVVLTVEAAGLFFGAKIDSFRIAGLAKRTTPPSSQNPCAFRVSRGQMHGLRCVGILTSDGQRAITFACRRGNIMRLARRLQKSSEISTELIIDEDSTELITVETKTLAEAFDASLAFLPYYQPCEFEWTNRRSQKRHP